LNFKGQAANHPGLPLELAVEQDSVRVTLDKRHKYLSEPQLSKHLFVFE
jgi:hypothetical protein